MGRMTHKKRAFAEALLDPECRSYSEAYRRAYDAEGMKPAAVRVEASKLAKDPNVTLIIDKHRARLEAQKARTAIAERQAITNRLWSEIDDPDTPSASRVAALRLLGLNVGLFTERTEATLSEPLPQSEAETLAEIEDMLGGASLLPLGEVSD
jgi:phage terminase small subunit